MTTDALPALLRIRSAAALVLHRAGYWPEQIRDHLGATTVQADPRDVTPQLLAGTAQYLRDAGFTYWGIAEAVTKLGGTPPRGDEEPDAWQHGVLFDLTTPGARA
ncbi:hypothetical protein [Streptomyces sp. NPDC057413]|uniref:hypothetical protein n=1 Tax=Streptomyces sp. NPDC057413 TaxID=3346124 RepID=UPI00369C552E